MIVKMTIEKDDGTVYVLNNVVDWSAWESDDVDQIVSEYKPDFPENLYPRLYDLVRDKCFKYEHFCNWDDLYEIVRKLVDELMEE